MDIQSVLQSALQELQDKYPDWTFRKRWDWLRKTKPELFKPTAEDNVPDTPLSHPSGTDSPDPRARPFKNYDQRDRDSRIVARAEAQKMVRAEIGREIAAKVNEIRKVEGVSFKRAWEKVKQRFPQIFAQAACVEEEIVEAADEARRRTERILTAEAPMLACYGLTPDDVPEPYRSDSWYH